MRVGVLRVVRWAMRSSPHACYGGAATPHIGEAPRRTVVCRPVAVAEVVLEEEAEAVVRALCPMGFLARCGEHVVGDPPQWKAARGRQGAGRL